MRTPWVLGAVFVLGACATAPPQELVDARAAYDHASAGPAGALAPDHLAVARHSLTQAENAYSAKSKSPVVRDLAYAAQREALAADAAAGAESARRDRATAEAAIAAATSAQQARAESEAARASAEEQRADTEAAARVRAEQDRQAREQEATTAEERARRTQETAAAEVQAERDARLVAEQQSAAAMQRLQQVAKVSEEARGRVITLNGSIVFSSGTATILPSAQKRLDDVAIALKNEPKAQFLVEGHADSRGSDDFNMKLSAARAKAVRDYLVEHGVDEARIGAVGKGEEVPIATNATAEGRANNRRVEIIINRREAQR